MSGGSLLFVSSAKPTSNRANVSGKASADSRAAAAPRAGSGPTDPWISGGGWRSNLTARIGVLAVLALSISAAEDINFDSKEVSHDCDQSHSNRPILRQR